MLEHGIKEIIMKIIFFCNLLNLYSETPPHERPSTRTTFSQKFCLASRPKLAIRTLKHFYTCATLLYLGPRKRSQRETMLEGKLSAFQAEIFFFSFMFLILIYLYVYVLCTILILIVFMYIFYAQKIKILLQKCK